MLFYHRCDIVKHLDLNLHYFNNPGRRNGSQQRLSQNGRIRERYVDIAPNRRRRRRIASLIAMPQFGLTSIFLVVKR